MPDIDPFVGIAADERLTEDEPGGFIQERSLPNAPSDQPNVELVYCLPLRRNSLLRNRATVTFGLRVPRTYGRSAYSYEVNHGRPARRSGTLVEPSDTLRLYVDRSVRIFPPPQATILGSRGVQHGFEVQFGTDSVSHIARRLRVLVVRVQLESQVPQTILDPFGAWSEPRHWVWRHPERFEAGVDAGDTGDTRTVYRRDWLTALVKESDRTGGARFSLVSEHTRELRYVNQVLSRGPVQRVLARIQLQYRHLRHPGAYFYRVVETRARPRLEIVISRNIRATLHVNGLGVSTLRNYARGQLGGLIGRVAGEWHPEIRIVQVAGDQVPRPGAPAVPATHALHEPASMAIFGDRIFTLPDAERDRALATLTMMVGMLPIVGDIYDLAEIALVVTTGRDFLGQEVETWELALMVGLAVLPQVPGGLRRMAGQVDDVRTALRRVGVTVESLRPTLLRLRPALARALAAARDDADRLLQALLAQRNPRRAVDLGKPVSEEVVDLLGSRR